MSSTSSDSSRKNSCAKFTPCELRAQSANTAKVILELGVEHTNDVFRVKAVRYCLLNNFACFIAIIFYSPLFMPEHWYFILLNETTGDEFVLEYSDSGISFTLLDDDVTLYGDDVDPRGRYFGLHDWFDKACFDRTHTGAEIAEYLNNGWSQSCYNALFKNCQQFVRNVSVWWGARQGDEQQ